MRTSIKPRTTPETEGFWDGCRKGELRVQRCGSCGRLRFPPQPMCPQCRSTERSWVPVSGSGHVYTFSVVTGRGSEPSLPGEQGHPFAVAVIELGEGVRMLADFDTEALDQLSIGAAVVVKFEPIDGEISLPRFDLVSATD